ncbi:hypothetical protein, partial [Helicobacter pullorum]|uniref:hypothetical protein n=1 Tax=Helicobacter pullorum TaxID=35818 RepID=UPI00242F39BF
MASALASNMAAAPSDLPSGVNQDFQNVVLEEASGINPKVTVSGTISNGTIISGTAIVSGGDQGKSGRHDRDSQYGDLVKGDGGATSTIINGWDIKPYNEAQGVNDGNGGVKVTKNITAWNFERVYEVLRGTKAGNLTIDKNYTINLMNGRGIPLSNVIVVSENASAATITNNGIIKHHTANSGTNVIVLADGASVDAIVNNGTMALQGTDVLKLEANSTLKKLVNTKRMSTTESDLIRLSGGTIKQIELSSGSTTSAGTNIINVQSSATIGTITATGATVNGSISSTGGITLDNDSSDNQQITSKSSIDNIQLLESSTITGDIILANHVNITKNKVNSTKNVTIKEGSKRIGNISLSGSSQLDGDIYLASNVGSTINGSGSGTVNVTWEAPQTLTIDSIVLNGDSKITGTIINGDSSVVSDKDSIVTIGEIQLNKNSSIGSIVNNRGTITNIALNENGTITNGITNNANGNIGTIVSNTNTNVSNTINNEGTIAKLLLNQGTINYSGNSGFFKEELVVGRDATLTINNGGSGGNGTIYIN